jgi:hypothetical protein
MAAAREAYYACINKERSYFDEKFDRMMSEINLLKEDNAVLKADNAILKADIAILKAKVSKWEWALQHVAYINHC